MWHIASPVNGVSNTLSHGLNEAIEDATMGSEQ